MKLKTVDKKIFLLTVILVVFGYIIFSSAALGHLTRDASLYASLDFKQAIVGILGGGLAMLILATIPLQYLKKFSLHLLIIAIGLNLLIFIPGLAQNHDGASRWLNFGYFSFQPSEVLKMTAILYYAAWIAARIKDIKNFKTGLLPLLVISGIVEGLMLLQHDTDPIIIAAFMAMFFVAGGSWKQLGLFLLVGLTGISFLVFTRPYIQERLLTFINPARDATGASYQIQQSLIAIGTGGFFGRGYGQSIQKFSYLPEAVGDSIFAVAAEEFGFIGSVILVILFLAFALRALKVAAIVKEPWGSILIVGFVVLMVGQSFMNIGAMLGILPLTGVPLLFVSQGGTSMLVGLAEVGIILNISRNKR